jgi:hypothetical protein
MTAKSRVTNKSVFEDGDKPAGSNYADLIDSFLSLADTTVQSVTSDVVLPNLTATSICTTNICVLSSVVATASVPTGGVLMPTNATGFFQFTTPLGITVAVPYFALKT